MEPVMEVEKVPKTRWKLTCYLCNQRMGACIQCGNKACYQAFHVTCARKARLFLKMKNSHGTLAVLDGTTILKAFCDKHCPADYSKENNVAEATRQARAFYKKTMRGRLWADSQASALAMAATHRHAVTEHQPDESQLTGASVEMSLSESKKKGNQPPQTIWKLPSGAPVIPKIVYDSIETSLQRFGVRKRKEFVADACRYWTLKREARRGAPLLKRLQLQMETFSSTEITRRNFPGMGPSGREKLARRIEFAKVLVDDLEKLKSLSGDVVERERIKLELALVEDEIIDTVYFPIAKLLSPIVEKALV
jgi:NuA3 HAT complex component NTO1